LIHPELIDGDKTYDDGDCQIIRMMKQREEIGQRLNGIESLLAGQDAASHAELPLETVTLAEVIREATDAVPAAARQGVRLVVAESVRSVPTLCTARTLLVQVLANLVQNAIESIRQTGRTDGEVDIEARREVIAGTEGVRIEIRDNGRGIAPGDLRRVFERGYSTKAQAGAGMGLHWCANTMNAMNGRIRAESEGPNQGARFFVELPLGEND